MELSIQIADGLTAAHTIGLVHRDIKPANLFLTQQNRVKILDFGLARQSPQLLSIADDAETMSSDSIQVTSAGTMEGTPDYMSPEQVRREELTASSDIFSLGIVLYQLLNGKHPFKKKSRLETASAILMSPLDNCPNTRDPVRSGLNSILARMLTKDVAARYADGVELLTELKRLSSSTGRGFSDIGDWPERITSPSIAVLPFVNLSADHENEYFCDGLAEELVGALSKVEGLQVAAWNSAFRFRGSDVNIREAGQQLGVSAVLEGSLRKMVKLGLERKKALFRPSTRNLEAYNLYLKGRYFWNRRGPADIQKALDSFQQAIRKDERFASALAGVADCYVVAGVQGAQDPNDVFPLAREAAIRALAVEPEMPEAMASLACVEAAYDWKWAAPELRFQKAIALNSQYGTAHHWYATHLLVPLGRFGEGREQIELACANDPLSMAIQIMAGLIAYFERDSERAIHEYQKALEMGSNFAPAHYFLGQAYEQTRSYQQGIRSLARALELSPGSSEVEAALTRVHALAGERDLAQEMLRQLRQKATTQYVSPVLFAQVLLGLEMHENAIGELQRALEIRATDLMWLKVRPVFDAVRGDSRVQRITSAVGLA